MPLWTIHHTPGLFSDAEKHELASRIADHYEAIGLPRFYAVTVFQEARPGNFYVGGEPVPVGARIVIDHIARHNAGPEARRRTAQWINGMLRPHLEARPGVHWEFHADETSEELWMINGLVPPPGGSAEEKAWAEANAASPY